MKNKVVQQEIFSQKPDLICIQETKLSKMDRKLCSKSWGGDDFEWLYLPFGGRAGVIDDLENFSVYIGLIISGESF